MVRSEKDLKRNVLVAVQGSQHPLLYSRALTASSIDWIASEGPEETFACKAKTRYRQPEQPCTVKRINQQLFVEFTEPQRAVTPDNP